KKLKDQFFNDFFGEVKSLGAWGGDFFLASSNKSAEETKAYFNNLGFDVFYRYSELVAELDSSQGFEAMNRHDPSSLLQ
ncbi:MAG: hypothetical protein L6Q33_14950, partial [Bacteriovoracaceae bacterium]|nr:hypothetical protein [Bacteriovoracaceae bacterium]